MTMTSHLPLSAAQLKLLCLWMVPTINDEKLDDGPAVDEKKVLAGLQRIMRKAPTFEDLKTATAAKVLSAFGRIQIELPDGVADVLTQFLHRWEPTGLHCNQADCGLPALFARGNVLDEKKQGERCHHCKRGTVEGSTVELTVFDWVNGRDVANDAQSIASGPQNYPIQTAELRKRMGDVLVAILDDKGVSPARFMHWLLHGKHDVSVMRTPMAVLGAVSKTGYLVTELDVIALGAYVDMAKGFKGGGTSGSQSPSGGMGGGNVFVLPYVSVATLRKILQAVLRDDSDFMAFCQDHFLSTYRDFGSGMGRMQKTTSLLTHHEPEEIMTALHEANATALKRALDALGIKTSLAALRELPNVVPREVPSDWKTRLVKALLKISALTATFQQRTLLVPERLRSVLTRSESNARVDVVTFVEGAAGMNGGKAMIQIVANALPFVKDTPVEIELCSLAHELATYS